MYKRTYQFNTYKVWAFVAFSLLILYPLLNYLYFKLNAAGVYQEPIAFRYFWSLRWLWESNQPIGNPQGQTVGVLHNLINLILNMVGFSATDPNILLARINLFIIFNHVALVLFSVLGFYLICRVCEPVTSVIAFIMFLTPIYCGDQIKQLLIWMRPDYTPFAFPLYLFGTFVLIKLMKHEVVSKRLIIYAGILSGIAVGLKITLLALVSVLFFVTVFFNVKRDFNTIAKRVSIFFASSFLTLLLVFLLQHLRSFAYLPAVIKNIFGFSSFVINSDAGGGLDHFTSHIINWGGYALASIICTLVLLAFSAFYFKNKPAKFFVLAFLPGVLIFTLPYLIIRWHHATIFEFYCEMSMLTVVLFELTILDSHKIKTFMLSGKKYIPLVFASIIAIILLGAHKQTSNMLAYVKPRSYLTEQTYEAHLKLAKNSTLFLSDGLGYEVIDDAIRKGGEDVWGGNGGMQSDNIVARLFPKSIIYHPGMPHAHINSNHYSTIAVYQHGNPEQFYANQQQILEKIYKSFAAVISSETWKPVDVIHLPGEKGKGVEGIYVIMKRT